MALSGWLWCRRCMSKMMTGGISAPLALALLAIAGPAQAQYAKDRFWAEASFFRPHVDSSIEINSTTNPGIGTDIDMEGDLGLDNDESLPAFLAGARISRNFSIVAEYFSIGRDATHTLDRNITIEGVTYPVAGSVTTEFNTDIYRLVLSYSFIRTDKAEAGASIGLHATDFEVGIEGSGTIGGGAPGQIQTRRQDFLAPIPTLGVYASYEILPRLTLSGRADYLSLSIDDYDGRLLNAQAKLSYRVLDNVGLGIAYRHVDYRVDVEKERYEGRFQYEFSGPAVFLEVGF